MKPLLIRKGIHIIMGLNRLSLWYLCF